MKRSRSVAESLLSIVLLLEAFVLFFASLAASRLGVEASTRPATAFSLRPAALAGHAFP